MDVADIDTVRMHMAKIEDQRVSPVQAAGEADNDWRRRLALVLINVRETE